MPNSHEKFHSSDGRRLILVADDELINREILGMVLQSNYEVIFAGDGRETLEKMRENIEQLSLVLMDLKMPVMGGLDVLRQVRKEPGLAGIPIIVLTADQDAEIESLSLGAIDFIPKPYPQAGVILARVRRTIELSENRQIIHSTERDPLTGLYNHEYFYRYAEQFDHYHKGMEMDAAVVDINHFHMINERFGTGYGDEVLRRIGERMREMVHDHGGIVCRREADTFMVYCPHRRDWAMVLESASAGLSGDAAANNRVRLRMGVYENVDKTLDIERRFDRAKMAADTVRGSFTKNIGIYDSALHEKELYSERLIEDFYTAVEEKQFQVFYQPKFDIRPETPVLASAEALVRWFHPSLGMISPGEFIPLFEDNGLIQTLDRYVWETAADQLRLWKEKYGFIVPVSVNVSRIDMYDPRLVETFQKILSANGLTPAEFLLEITESAYTQDSEQIIETVNLLRSLGFSIEMDDFGTGYSSLNMISTLPIDALKLDMQFIRTAFSQNRDTRMLEVIIDIADYLSVPTIAEGVETKDQLQALKAMGCDIVQGYYFSKPVPHEEFKQFLVKRVAQVGHGDDGNMAAENRRNRKQASPEKAVLDFTTLTSALSSDVESIYYVDTVLDTYMEFRANGAYKKLQIEVTGDDFFEDCRKNISEVVFEDDRDKVAACLEKGKLLSVLRRHHVFSMVYRLVIEGSPLYYRLKVVQADASDGRYIIIGVSNIDAQLPEEERLESQRTNSVTFAQISEALSRDYFSIYYVNIRTNHFIEYSSDEAYKALGIETMGEDFFGQARESIGRVICPEDQQHFLEIFTKDRVLLELAKTGAFSMVYRMMFGDVPTYVQMKATHMSDPYDPHIVIGMSNVEEQMRREREHSLAVQAANRDPLTGVKSKHAYTEMEKEVNESIARGDEDLFAIAVCDLNGLKNVNDTLGHIAGDKYLKDGCTVICQVFKHSPVYRIGGDEFAAVLRGADYEDRGSLLALLDEKNAAQQSQGRATVAAGISEYRPGEDHALASIFERADARMYANKKKMKEQRTD